MAEGEGFEPPKVINLNGFQDRRIQPLCHPSGLITGSGRAGGTRTPNRRFWRPLLYQLSYRPNPKNRGVTRFRARLAYKNVERAKDFFARLQH